MIHCETKFKSLILEVKDDLYVKMNLSSPYEHVGDAKQITIRWKIDSNLHIIGFLIRNSSIDDRLPGNGINK